MSRKPRYSIVGTGGRSLMFFNALAGSHREYAQLVSMCDLSQVRMDYYNRHLSDTHQHSSVPTFKPDQFEQMIGETRPDTVIVCTMDSTHHEYIIRAMDAGCNVICEKPMTVDAQKARAILDTIERTGRSLQVTFNVRYTPLATKVREMMMQGVVGRPTAVDLAWTLDTSHGADYFRRWHREKDKSGGLLIHKATHHFDMVNWWIDSQPQTVFAMGGLEFYGKTNARIRGENYDYVRYTGAKGAKSDPFSLPLDQRNGDDENDKLKSLYLDAEEETGYIRDRNVFGDGISIEDTMAVMARYDNGVILNYSLIAYSPWEGFRASITGDKGRIEIYVKHGSHIVKDENNDKLANAESGDREDSVTVFPMFGQPYQVKIPVGEGSHGGGDVRLLNDLFSPNSQADPLNRAASQADGAASLLIGLCANESISTGQPINCHNVLDLSQLAKPAVHG